MIDLLWAFGIGCNFVGRQLTLGCGRVDKLDHVILAPKAAGKGETILDLTKDKFSESKARPSNNLVLAVLWRLEKYVRTM